MLSASKLSPLADRARHNQYSLSTKQLIVSEEFGNGLQRNRCHRSHVVAVAKSYNVRATQIDRWAASFKDVDKALIKEFIKNKKRDNENGKAFVDLTIDTSTTCDSSDAGRDLTDPNAVALEDEFNGIVDSTDYPEAVARLHKKKTKRVANTNNQRLPGGGRKSTFSPDMEKNLKEYFFEQRHLTNSVSLTKMRVKARKINPYECELIPEGNPENPNAAINQCIYRCLYNWDQSWRRCTAHRSQNTRHITKTCMDFNKYIDCKIRMLGISKHHVFNVDETNVPFAMDTCYTWGQRGVGTIAIRKPESTQRLSCLLGMNMTGTLKVMPHLVFKGMSGKNNRVLSELRKREAYPDTCTYGVSKRAWFNEDVFLEWIEDHWRPYMDANRIPLTYLLLDVCTVHCTREIREAFHRHRTEVDYLPKGYTAKLQPLDVGVNGPFRSYIRASIETFLVAAEGNPKVHRRDVSNWIDTAWKKVSRKTIRNAWEKSGYAVESLSDALYNSDIEEDEQYI